jgi:hypothetical protein
LLASPLFGGVTFSKISSISKVFKCFWQALTYLNHYDQKLHHLRLALHFKKQGIHHDQPDGFSDWNDSIYVDRPVCLA